MKFTEEIEKIVSAEMVRRLNIIKESLESDYVLFYGTARPDYFSGYNSGIAKAIDTINKGIEREVFK